LKTIYITDLTLGQTFTGIFAVSCTVKKTEKTSWLDVAASDKTGTISGKRWGARGGAPAKDFTSPYAELTATVEEYPKGSGVLQLNIAHLAPFDPKGDLGDFEVCAVLSFGALKEAFEELIGSIKNPYLRDVVDFVFSDGLFSDSFDIWPAAVGMHHAVKHGLLQHTFEVADMVAMLCKTHRTWGYAPLDRDLAVAGALLHDIGKVDEMAPLGSGYDFTLEGGFEGHILSGWARVSQAIGQTDKREDFPAVLAYKLKHIVLAHHGKREYGSPVEPQIPEAELVHQCDMISARLYMYAKPESKPAPGASFAKSYGLGHRMFMPAPKPTPMPKMPDEPFFNRPRVPADMAFEPQDEIALEGMRESRAPKPAKPANQSGFVPADRSLFDGGVRHNAAGEEDHFAS
jgi:3'-5' exoribonuclease